MMMQLKCCSWLACDNKSVKVTQIQAAVLQGLHEKKGIPAPVWGGGVRQLPYTVRSPLVPLEFKWAK